jgi:hypothetical protein
VLELLEATMAWRLLYIHFETINAIPCLIAYHSFYSDLFRIATRYRRRFATGMPEGGGTEISQQASLTLFVTINSSSLET